VANCSSRDHGRISSGLDFDGCPHRQNEQRHPAREIHHDELGNLLIAPSNTKWIPPLKQRDKEAGWGAQGTAPRAILLHR
jgi:hypothetical protein